MKIRNFLTITLPAVLLVVAIWLMHVSGLEWLIERLHRDD